MSRTNNLLKGHFTQIPNEVLRDPDLSLKAKGIYSLILSHGENYHFSSERLAKETSDGPRAVKSALKKLVEKGYLSRKKQPSGRMEYKIIDLAERKELLAKNDQYAQSQNSTKQKQLKAGSSQSENSTHKEERGKKNKGIKRKKINQEDPPPLTQREESVTNQNQLLQKAGLPVEALVSEEV